MEHGRGLYTPVVFTLEDLKEIYMRDAHGRIGMWAFHFEVHPGHLQCAKIANEECDWVIGVLWNNYGEGERWMMGNTDDKDGPITPYDIEVLKQNSDVVMIFTGDYHPFKEYWDVIKKEFDETFPMSLLKREGLEIETSHAALLYSVAVRILMHDIYGIKLDLHPTCGRNNWRHIYSKWLMKRFGIDHPLYDAARDKYGNIISSSRNRIPSKYTNRIQKTLLLPHFESIEEVNNYIKDIDELEAVTFRKQYGWINVKFKFANNDKYWWAEGLKLCK